MRKTVIVLLAGAMSLTQLKAQTDQGTILVGGNLGFNSSSSTSTFGTDDPIDGPSYSSFSINPFGGYFISDNFVVGLSIGYASNGITVLGGADGDIELTDTESWFNVGPFARYYYVNNDAFMLWAGLGVNIGSGKYNDEYVDLDDDFNEVVASEESKMSSMSFGVGPGATIMLGEKCGLEITYGSLGFASYKMTDDGTDAGAEDDFEYKESGFGLNWSNSFGFGVSFAF
jgi:hypothetical protein